MTVRPGPEVPYQSEVWELFCFENSDDQTCLDHVEGYYEYDISIAANAFFVGIFGLSLLGFLATYAFTRRGLSFTVAMTLGVICEILGYAGRVMGWDNRWSENGFLIQICCLTIGPAFLAAGVYLCLRRIVYAFGKENSMIAPEWYTRIFIPCDFVSLLLQAAGGAMASIGSQDSDPKILDSGNNIMIAGLAFQVFTLLVFIIVAGLFAFRVWKRQRELGDAALDQNPMLVKIRGSLLFRGMLGALTLATICIFWRSVYRVAELSEGWEGPLMKRQDLFIGFEGVMIVVACLVLNVFHPSICFKDLMVAEEGKLNMKFWKKKQRATGQSKNEGTSETEYMSSA